MTKWEKFAKAKGIVNRKKASMVYDDQFDEYKSTWGYKSKANDMKDDWLIEIPDPARLFY